MTNKELINELKYLLKNLFQFENNDLDFGIYRIINIKRKEISEFIDEDLFDIIQDEIKKVENTQKKKVNEENELEAEIYNNIINFFSRYYDNGDFISKRRYSKNNYYAIPYNGEEVHLYWANNDQYYIKTAKNFKNYSCKVGKYKLNFEIVTDEINVEKNNIKENVNRFFILVDVMSPFKYVIEIHFGYRGLTDDELKTIQKEVKKTRIAIRDVNKYNLNRIKQQITLLNPQSLEKFNEKHRRLDGELSDSSELEWHLNKYVTKHEADYFIHKDLKVFLKQELDFYIKNELFVIDDIDSAEELTVNIKLIKVFKNISLQIITFLHQIEEFQKKLWEKKKFVVSTDYVISLDYINEKHYPIILENKKQLIEWRKLYSFDINRKKSSTKVKLTDFDLESVTDDLDILKQNKTLLIDTRHFNTDFKFQILSEIENLDENITGILINSENFQALNLLLKKYNDKIKCCYIDPPYNSKSSEIIYKNTFKHSSWLSLMENRIELTMGILKRDDGILIIAIDDNEQEKLGLLLERMFPNYEKVCITVIHNPAGIQGKNFSYSHEYAYFIFPSGKELIGKRKIKKGKETPLRDWGKDTALREASKTCFYPIKIKDGKIIEFGNVCDDDFHPESANVIKDDGLIYVYPIDQNGVERKWRFAKGSVESIKNELFCKQINRTWEIRRNKSFYRYKTVWDESEYYANVFGSKLLNNIITNGEFTFPKSVHLVKDCIDAATQNFQNPLIIDFFAGSGTTGHAVFKLNREDNNNRKFILVEMGHYFNSVLKPRIMKTIYSDNWKNGKPIDSEGLGKQIIKYQVLEQYEDSLNNLDFITPNSLALESKDYKIKYMLNFETNKSKIFLNLDMMDNPFKYKLEIEENNEIKTANIDLIETFNYIAGIFVDKIIKKQDNSVDYIIVYGKREEKKVIVVWRNKNDSFDPKRDKEFVEKEIIADEEYDEILVNGSSLIENAISLDGIFRKSMLGE